MIPTAVRLSKASRRPLTPKRGNKDYYKGTRQAYLPGGHRTGAPGKHVVVGKAKYRLLDEKVRVYVAPSIQEIETSRLKPYVALGTRLSLDEGTSVFGRFTGPMGLTPQHFLRIAREHTYARQNADTPHETPDPPDWMAARIRLGTMPTSQKGIAVHEEKPIDIPGENPIDVPGEKPIDIPGAQKPSGVAPPKRQKRLRELEIVA